MKPNLRLAENKFRRIYQTLLETHDVNLFDVITSEDPHGRGTVRRSFFKELLRSAGTPFLSDDIFVLCERYQDDRRQVCYLQLFAAVGLENGRADSTVISPLRRVPANN